MNECSTMAWEERRGRRYYYSKRRIGKQVVSQYHGAGALAESWADIDTFNQRRAALERQRHREEQAVEAAMDQQIDALGILLNHLIAVHLLVTGHHVHKRQWRKQRESNYRHNGSAPTGSEGQSGGALGTI
jgi:predicted ATPase